jgi:prolyl-tRNA editing enzyme YbaK/EbsC (Cys-tRNA(Pro) deacylase)
MFPAFVWSISVTEKLPDSAESVQRVLQSKGIDARVVVLPQSARTAKDAAAAIRCQVEQIAKSLIFRRTDTDQPVLVIASGSNRVDEQLVSAFLNAEIVKADADFVRSATGFAIGGIPPLGHRNPIHTLVDQSLLQLDPVWAAAGTPHTVFSISPHQLVEITNGQVIAVSNTTLR